VPAATSAYGSIPPDPTPAHPTSIGKSATGREHPRYPPRGQPRCSRWTCEPIRSRPGLRACGSAVAFPRLNPARRSSSPDCVREFLLDHSWLTPHDPDIRVADQARLISTSVRESHLARHAPDLHHNTVGLPSEPDQPIAKPHFRRTQPQFDQARRLPPMPYADHHRASQRHVSKRARSAAHPGTTHETEMRCAGRFRKSHSTGQAEPVSGSGRSRFYESSARISSSHTGPTSWAGYFSWW
jgi:hypothetical protein